MRKFLSEQSGRSMIEMLGVLAIIGVLSVGGIAGYSKAMAKYKQNKLGDQISMLVTNIRTLYGNSQDYTGLSGESAINMGAVDREMQVTPGIASAGIKNVYNSTESVFVSTDTDGNTFFVTVTNLPSTACTYLASADYGSSIGSGWKGVTAQAAAAAAGVTALPAAGTGVQTKTDATAGDLPMTVAAAAAVCTGDNTNTVILQFE